MFQPSINYKNISCILSSDFENSILSCTTTHEGSGSVESQLREVQGYCTDDCHNAMRAFAKCMDSSGLDGGLLLRYWDSGCMTHPKDDNKVCLEERLKLLKTKDKDYKSLSESQDGPIACDACTRVSMAKMIENYDYLKSESRYSGNMPSSSAVDNAKNNIQNQCGKPYTQLELNAGGPGTSVNTDDLPFWAIILIIIAGILIGLIIVYLLYKRHKRRHTTPPNAAFAPSYSTLNSQYKPTSEAPIDYYSDPSNSTQNTFVPPQQYPQQDNWHQSMYSDISSNTPLPYPQQQQQFPPQPHQRMPYTGDTYQDPTYDNMRVTHFNQ